MSQHTETFEQIVASNDFEVDVVVPVAAEDPRLVAALMMSYVYDRNRDDFSASPVNLGAVVAQIRLDYDVSAAHTALLLNTCEQNIRF